jgi:hypothetical protein
VPGFTSIAFPIEKFVAKTAAAWFVMLPAPEKMLFLITAAVVIAPPTLTNVLPPGRSLTTVLLTTKSECPGFPAVTPSSP